MDEHEEFVVKCILDARRIRGKLHYFIDWEGYGANERSWEPSINLANAPDAVNSFHRQNPDKPGPDHNAAWKSALKRGILSRSTHTSPH